MDRFLSETIQNRIERTSQKLTENGMPAQYVADSHALIALLKEELPQGASVSIGGAKTLFETGVMELLRSGDYAYHDRLGRDVEDENEVFLREREVFFSDYFFTSTNAITEDGELYNVDGIGNRVAPMTFGPAHVIVIAGANKIVKDMDAALKRMKTIAAPAINIRRQTGNPCISDGKCHDCAKDSRICSFGFVTGRQLTHGRIRIFILPQSFGY